MQVGQICGVSTAGKYPASFALDMTRRTKILSAQAFYGIADVSFPTSCVR